MYIRVKEGDTCRKLDIHDLNWGGVSELMKSKFQGFDFENWTLICKPPAGLAATCGDRFHLDSEIQFNKLRNFMQNLEETKSALMTFQVVKVDSFKTQDTTIPYKEGGRDIVPRISNKLQIGEGGKPKLPTSSASQAKEWESCAQKQSPGISGLSSSLAYSRDSSDWANQQSDQGNNKRQMDLMSSIFTANEHSDRSAFSILQEEVDLNRELLSTDGCDESDGENANSHGHSDFKRHRKGRRHDRREKGSKNIQRVDEGLFGLLFPSLGKAQEHARAQLLGLERDN